MRKLPPTEGRNDFLFQEGGIKIPAVPTNPYQE
jgi:hypothetical protein